jgi:hypothetical protein
LLLEMRMVRMKRQLVLALVVSFIASGLPSVGRSQTKPAQRSHQVTLLENWLLSHRGAESGLPVSHVGDSRFTDWCFTYDAAVVGWALPTIFTIAPVAGRLPDHAMRIGGEER